MTAHDLYKTGDKDAPDLLKDRNGEVILHMCRRCGCAESGLLGECGATRSMDDWNPEARMFGFFNNGVG